MKGKKKKVTKKKTKRKSNIGRSDDRPDIADRNRNVGDREVGSIQKKGPDLDNEDMDVF
ncbi:MAG: hypothetical protein ACP5N9_01060 [Candidatus Bilamarchaeum sp.]|jgi:hypothetical protein